MELRCPRCTSSNLQIPRERGAERRCLSCRARFPRAQALVRVVEAEALGAEMAACTCDERRGCPQCFRRAEEMIGKTVRDPLGREWRVTEVGEKDHFPTISNDVFWDLPDQVEVVEGT
jgi:hypothetical protein